jgi:hypothetical protein
MKIDLILETFNRCDVAYLLLGGVNFLLRHDPVTTVDIDSWIEDSPHGAIDVFRAVRGLSSWGECRSRAVAGFTPAGTPFVGLCDEDMLQCQMALPEGERKLDRIRTLRARLGERNDA